jgi:UDP-2-acetamido-3-amino-2,3-dideoxy-glucuronate N-acetyltransferase
MRHASADIDEHAIVSPTAKIWHLAQIRENASIGNNVVVGRGAYIGSGVKVGENSKIQNHALVYEPAILGRGVFIGPSVVLTNDKNPRAVSPEGNLKSPHDWSPVGVIIGDGASIGAHSVCIAPIRIGEWAMVAAGSVVTRDVPAYALVAGNPARQIGWVGESGVKLKQDEQNHRIFVCPSTCNTYILEGKALRKVLT